MQTSANGRKFITQEEGCVLTAYRDSVGVLTIGVGHTSAAGAPVVTAGLKITAAQADEILTKDLTKFEKYVSDAVKVALNQNQYDALVSLCFNIGPGAFKGSSVVRLLNQGNYAGAADAMLLWKRAGNNANLLLARRKRERTLFLSPVTGAPEKAVQPVSPQPATPVAKSFWERLGGLFKRS